MIILHGILVFIMTFSPLFIENIVTMEEENNTTRVETPLRGSLTEGHLLNLVRQCSYLRGRGEATKYIREIIHNICHIFENDIMRAMYAWAPGKPLDRIDELADFIVRVRDVNGVFGERDVAYALLWTWYRFFPEWALRIFQRFVGGVGCWSDVKYMCGFLREYSEGFTEPLCGSEIHTSVVFRDAILDIIIQQLKQDHDLWGRVMEDYFENRRQFFGIGEKYEGENENGGWKRTREPLMKRPCARKYLSLASKWCPRETSKYGWVFALLIERFPSHDYQAQDPQTLPGVGVLRLETLRAPSVLKVEVQRTSDPTGSPSLWTQPGTTFGGAEAKHPLELVVLGGHLWWPLCEKLCFSDKIVINTAAYVLLDTSLTVIPLLFK